ncbi:MAG: MFS transporter [Oscillospiraceae bacterium]|nr:MFS transporter [Oscillospiraceae bacterium]
MKLKLKKEKIRYLLGLSGQNIFYALISSCFAYYLQFTVLIPAFWLGIILSTAKIFDAIKDPFIGAYIDKSKWPLAKYLQRLPIPTAVITILCFAMKIYSDSDTALQNAAVIIYGFLVFILWEIVFSFGDIPMISYPNELCENERERINLLSLRPLGAMVCSVCCLIIQPIAFAVSGFLGNSQKDERNAFFIVAIVFSVVGCSMYRLTVSKKRSYNTKITETDKTQQYKYILSNPLLKKITVSGLLSSMSALQGVVLSALVAFYFSSKNSGLTLLYTFLLGAGSFIGLMISAFLVPILSERLGNIKAYILCNLATVLPNILIFVLYLGNKTSMNTFRNFSLMLIFSLISGSFLSLASNVRTLLINDAVELENKLSGSNPTALFFSFQTAITKIQNGVSSLISSAGYMLIGFSSAETAKLNEFIANGFIARESSEYTSLFTMLFFLFSVLPALSSLLAVLPFVNSEKQMK